MSPRRSRSRTTPPRAPRARRRCRASPTPAHSLAIVCARRPGRRRPGSRRARRCTVSRARSRSRPRRPSRHRARPGEADPLPLCARDPKPERAFDGADGFEPLSIAARAQVPSVGRTADLRGRSGVPSFAVDRVVGPAAPRFVRQGRQTPARGRSCPGARADGRQAAAGPPLQPRTGIARPLRRPHLRPSRARQRRAAPLVPGEAFEVASFGTPGSASGTPRRSSAARIAPRRGGPTLSRASSRALARRLALSRTVLANACAGGRIGLAVAACRPRAGIAAPFRREAVAPSYRGGGSRRVPPGTRRAARHPGRSPKL